MSEDKNKKHTVTSQVNIQLNSVKSKTSTVHKKVFQPSVQESPGNKPSTNEPAASNKMKASSNEDASWYTGRRSSSVKISSKKIPLASKKSMVSNAVSFYEGSPTNNGSNKARVSGQEQKSAVRFRRNGNYDKLLSKFTNNSKVSIVLIYFY